MNACNARALDFVFFSRFSWIYIKFLCTFCEPVFGKSELFCCCCVSVERFSMQKVKAISKRNAIINHDGIFISKPQTKWNWCLNTCMCAINSYFSTLFLLSSRSRYRDARTYDKFIITVLWIYCEDNKFTQNRSNAARMHIYKNQKWFFIQLPHNPNDLTIKYERANDDREANTKKKQLSHLQFS